MADYRRTIVDLTAKNYYGTMRRMAHEHGLRVKRLKLETDTL